LFWSVESGTPDLKETLVVAHNKRAWWNLAECIAWICTRDLKQVDTLRRKDADEALTQVMMRYRIGFCLTLPPLSSTADAEPIRPKSDGTQASTESEPADPAANAKNSHKQTADSGASTPGESSDPPLQVAPVVADGLYLEAPADPIAALIEEVRNGRLEMWDRKVGGRAFTRIEPVEFADLTFRIVPGLSEATMGLWMPAEDAMVWTSLQCPSATVVGLWPASNRNTADVRMAIFDYLVAISRPEAPLTKAAARDKSLKEVSNAYPEAFEHACRQLDISRKRRRGQHGPRAH
jgi:hypothetical protein